MYPDKTFIQKDTCTPMLAAALFLIAKKQPKHPLIEEQIKKMWGVCVCVCVCVMEYYLATKKNEIILCSNMDRPRDSHTK